jgi:RES domain-containing protein
LSGVGARRFGGRWNPPDVCATVYLAQPVAACIAEFDRLAASNGLEPVDMLRSPRELHTVDVADLGALDLREPEQLDYVGLSVDDLLDDDWTACQAVGHAAYFLKLAGVVAPSATGSGFVIAAFEARVEPSTLTLVESQTLDEAAYRLLGRSSARSRAVSSGLVLFDVADVVGLVPHCSSRPRAGDSTGQLRSARGSTGTAPDSR